MKHYPMDLKGVDGQDLPRNIVVPYVGDAEALPLLDALDDVPYRLRAAATIFRMIYRMTAGGFGPDEGELCAICEMTADALDKPGTSSAQPLETFATTLRAAMGCTKRRLETLEGKGKE